MFKYTQAVTCSICDQKKEENVWHFDIYVSGSEGVTLCLDCILFTLEQAQKDENIVARRALGNLIHKLSLEAFSKRWKERMKNEQR